MSEHGPKIEYEKTDADLKSVTKVGVGIFLLATVVSLALWPIMRAMANRQAKEDAAPPPIAFDPARQAPEPRLQGEPYGDWLSLRRRQEALLASYGWVDESGGVARIPIDRAMKIVLERGLPSRTPTQGVAPTPSTPPTPAPGGHP